VKSFVFALLSLFIPLAHAEPVPLTIGDTTIQFPVDAGYVRASTAEPKYFEVVQAALPTTNRLVEVFLTPADLDRMRAGGTASDVYYEVQVVRDTESRPIGMDEWNENKPQLTAGMSKLDMNELAAKEGSSASARVSAAAGKSVNLSFGNISSPTIYRETPMSVEFGMSVPLRMNSGGQTVGVNASVAGAIAVVRNRLVLIYAYRAVNDDASIADLHARLDALVDQTQALNPSDPNLSTSTGLFKGVGRSALIGGVIGSLIGVFLMLIKRAKGTPKA
jgi:hypothetical protein